VIVPPTLLDERNWIPKLEARTTHVDVSPNGFTAYKKYLQRFKLLDLCAHTRNESFTDANFENLRALIINNVGTLKILRLKLDKIPKQAEMITEQFRQLQQLEISFERWDDWGFLESYSEGNTFFGSLIECSSSSLKQIKVSGNQGHKYSLFTEVQSEMARLTRMEVSDIGKSWNSDPNSHATGCSGLRNIISKSGKLEVLKIMNSTLREVCIVESKHSCLSTLSLQSISIDVVALKSMLINLPNLQNLELQNCKLLEKVDFTCQLPKLTRLEAVNSPGIVTAFINGMPSLKVLKVSRNEIDDMGPYLQHGSLSKISVCISWNKQKAVSSKSSATNLIAANCETLVHLQLGGVDVGDFFNDEKFTLHALKRLEMSNVIMTKASKKALQSKLPTHINMEGRISKHKDQYPTSTSTPRFNIKI